MATELTNLKYELNKLGEESKKFLIDVLQRNGKIASGDLIKSIDYKVIEDANGILLKIIANETFNFVDEGRRAGARMPPITPIENWMKRKGIGFKKMSSKSAAFLVARSISQKGIKPLRLKKQLVNDFLGNRAQVLLKAAAQKDIQKIIDNIVSK